MVQLRKKSTNHMATKAWLITGATRGICSEIAKATLGDGNQVVATGRKPKAVTKAPPVLAALLPIIAVVFIIPLDWDDHGAVFGLADGEPFETGDTRDRRAVVQVGHQLGALLEGDTLLFVSAVRGLKDEWMNSP